MQYLLGFSVLIATLNSIFLKKAKIGNNCFVFNFNAISSALWCIILFLFNGYTLTINYEILLWGVAYGLIQAMFILFKVLSLRSGPVSVTTLIGNSSLLLSIGVSALLWSENIGFIQVTGVIFLILSIILCTYKQSKTAFTPYWKLYAFFFFIFAGLVGIIFKAFSKSANYKNTTDMMLVSAIVMTFTYLLIALKQKSLKPFINLQNKHNFIFYAILTGFLSCIYNRLNITLSGKIDAIIFFPVFNGGVVILSCILGVIICGEKLTLKQILGILIGCIALCIITL